MLAIDSILYGRYKVKRLLDEGAFGDFYLAYDQQEKRSVGLKVIAYNTPGVYSPFEAAVKTLATINHQALPEIVDWFSIEGQHIYVCHHHAAESLAEWRLRLPQKRLSPQIAALAMVAVIEAIEQMHSHSPIVLHHDLRLANIFVSSEGQLTISNFGLVPAPALQRLAHGGSKAASSELPIVAQQSAQSGQQDDLYAVGEILYTLVTGVVPPAASERTASDGLIAPQQLRSELSPKLEQVIMGLLSLAHDKRFPSAAIALQALRDALEPKICTVCAGKNPFTTKFCAGCGFQLPVEEVASAIATAWATKPEQEIAAPPAPSSDKVIVSEAKEPPVVAEQPAPTKKPYTPLQGWPQKLVKWPVLIVAAIMLVLAMCVGTTIAAPSGTMLSSLLSTLTNRVTPSPTLPAATPTQQAATPTKAIATSTPTPTIDRQATQGARDTTSAIAAAATATMRRLALEQAGTAQAAQTSEAQRIQTSEAATVTASAPTATLVPPPTPRRTPTPTPQPRLRFVLKGYDDDPTCVSVQIKGRNTAGWRFTIDGLGNLVGTFDGGGNARTCGLGPNQEVTLTVFDSQGRGVRGGVGVPVKGSAILIGDWR